jgi:hypothetical protein
MYLVNSWDKDDVFKQTSQIGSTRLNQGFPDAQLFGAAISLRIDSNLSCLSLTMPTQSKQVK